MRLKNDTEDEQIWDAVKAVWADNGMWLKEAMTIPGDTEGIYGQLTL